MSGSRVAIFNSAGSGTSRIGKPNLATLRWFFWLFLRFSDPGKYLEPVEPVPLIIATTAHAAVIYGAGQLMSETGSTGSIDPIEIRCICPSYNRYKMRPELGAGQRA